MSMQPLPPPLANLTPREMEVLAHIADGRDNAFIAADMTVSVRTVENYINKIFQALGLSEKSDINPRVRAAIMYLAGNNAETYHAAMELARSVSEQQRATSESRRADARLEAADVRLVRARLAMERIIDLPPTDTPK